MGKGMMTPGPGHYSMQRVIGKDGPASSIHQRLNTIDQAKNPVPGPGSYEANLKNRKAQPSFVYGTEKRQFGAKQNFTVPASNAYNPNTTCTLKNAATWRFGSEERKGLERKTGSPGPGNYKLPSAAFENGQHKFYMGIKLND